jgi:hypothetical protein
MQNLLQAIPDLLRLSGDDALLREQLVFAVWRKVAGAGVVQSTAPLALDGQQLRIAVLDRTWKTQLEQIAPEYLARIGRLLGSPLVTRLLFEIDPTRIQAARSVEAPAPFPFHRTEALMESLEEDAAAIRDSELRAIFLHAAARSIERVEEATPPRDSRSSGS